MDHVSVTQVPSKPQAGRGGHTSVYGAVRRRATTTSMGGALPGMHAGWLEACPCGFTRCISKEFSLCEQRHRSPRSTEHDAGLHLCVPCTCVRMWGGSASAWLAHKQAPLSPCALVCTCASVGHGAAAAARTRASACHLADTFTCGGPQTHSCAHPCGGREGRHVRAGAVPCLTCIAVARRGRGECAGPALQRLFLVRRRGRML